MYGIDTCNMKLQYSLMIDSIIPIAKFIDHRIAILGKTKTKRTKIIDTKNKKMKPLETGLRDQETKRVAAQANCDRVACCFYRREYMRE
jgi:hypothetical protein